MVETGIFELQAVGQVVEISTSVNQKDNKETNKLQFLIKDGDKGLKVFDVKVENSKRDDLLQFVGQNVLLRDLKVSQMDFNKFYKIDSINNIIVKNKKAS